MLYKVIEEHKARSISSGIYTIKVGKEIDGIEQNNGYIRFNCLERDMYIPIEKIEQVSI
jgi:hypothetical protein